MHPQVLIPILDRQETTDSKNPGHYFNITLDFLSNNFKVFDSYRTDMDPKLLLTAKRVVHSVKSLWSEGFSNDPTAKNKSDFDITFSDMPKTSNK